MLASQVVIKEVENAEAGSAPTLDAPTLFFDGECALCRRCVRVLRHWDRKGQIRFEPLPIGESGCDSVLWLNGSVCLLRTDALVATLRCCGGFAAVLGTLLRLVPHGLRDTVYRLVARSRQRLWKLE